MYLPRLPMITASSISLSHFCDVREQRTGAPCGVSRFGILMKKYGSSDGFVSVACACER